MCVYGKVRLCEGRYPHLRYRFRPRDMRLVFNCIVLCWFLPQEMTGLCRLSGGLADRWRRVKMRKECHCTVQADALEHLRTAGVSERAAP